MEDMREHGLKPDVVSYSAAINACEKRGIWELDEGLRDCVDVGMKGFKAVIDKCTEMYRKCFAGPSRVHTACTAGRH